MPYTDARTAVAGARLIVTSTSHSGPPFLEREWLSEGALVIMIDRLRLITPSLLARADRLVTNSQDSLAKWGVEGSRRAIESFPEIVAAGRATPVGPSEIVLYDAGGLAIADLALAALLWSRVKDQPGR